MTTLFVTGATGYLGRHLMEELCGREGLEIRALVRDPASHSLPQGVRPIAGDLENPSSLREGVDGCDSVLHLAALTGKGSRRAHFRVNADGTEALVKAAEEGGQPRFLYVSSIAAGFDHPRHYHYADSKREAEKIVRQSALPWCIVRPTMIFGPSAPVLDGLLKLAVAPFVPLFGSGQARVQPVGVSDLAQALVDLLDRWDGEGETWDFGGRDTPSLRELLLDLRQRQGRGDQRILRLPLRPIRTLLFGLEKVMLPLLPLTAGQLSSLDHDGRASSNPLMDRRRDSMPSLDALLAEIL